MYIKLNIGYNILLFILYQSAHDSEHQRTGTPPTVIDITSQPNSPTKSPPAKRTRTGAGFKSFHLNGSNASPDKATLDGALRAQTHASPREVRLLRMVFTYSCRILD